ncbi:MAG: Trk family potassium uptake protein [Chloroflexi bacterium]|nr:Trk family potassium uptake protein [Chloroflexota bacterium]
MTRADPRRPADRVLRRSRIQPETVRLRRRRRLRITPKPWMVMAAFVVVIGLGGLLLSLPVASESREWTSGVDALFTSTSAVSVTGLVRFDSAEHWSGFGETVIATLIQVGGLGVTLYAGMLVLLVGGRFGLRGREFFGFELMGANERDVRRLLTRIVVFMVVVEAVTFVLLLPWFIAQDGGGTGLWRALFHAVSAFNNAGFDLMGGGTGFQGQVSSPYPLAVMGVAAFLGSLSFLTVFQMRRRPRLWNLDTRLVVIGMFGLLGAGMLVFLVGEVQGGRMLDGLDVGDTLANSFFLSVNRTTGMATVELAQAQDSTTTALLVLMFIGGASTSTAGGIKIGAFMVSLVVVGSALRGRHRAEVFGREIPASIVIRAVAVTMLALVALALGIWILALTEGGSAGEVPFLPLAFEAMSALANVGWSQGLTAGLTTGGAVVLMVLMFTGRLGTLMIALSISERPLERYRYPESAVRIG